MVLDRRLEITGLRADGTDLPGRADDHAHRRARPADLHRLPARHHRPQGRRGRAAGVPGADREGRGRRAARARARPARRRAAAARRAGARPAHGASPPGRRTRRAPSELLDAAIGDLAEATRELRELARGIHPAALTEGGLRPALEALVARSSVPSSLVAVPDARFAAPVEATAYFIVAEGLTNAARHAAATRVEVAVMRVDDSLRVEVRDDGRGGAGTSARLGAARAGRPRRRARRCA